MKIKMSQTVEDMHKWVVQDENGQDDFAYDTRVFDGGAEYDEVNGGPDWARRAAGFVRLGYAVEV